MAITPGSEATLQAAARWKERCLLNDGSVFSQDASLWTLDHIEELVEHFVNNPLTDKRPFLRKLEEQTGSASPEARKLMAELIWVLMLFPSNFNYDTKVKKIGESWGFSGEPLPDSDALRDPLQQGIGSAGQGFINHQPFELAFLILFVRHLKQLTGDERRSLLDDPWKLVAHLDSYEGRGQRQFRHILPHLLLPQYFERIASSNHKRQILQAFGLADVVEGDDLEQVDRALLELRQRLREEYPDRQQLDFYRPPLIERWQAADLPTVELNAESLERVRDAFLRRFPDFVSFEDRGHALDETELGYKHVLRNRLLEVFEQLPTLADLTEDRAVQIVKDIRTTLTQKLTPFDFAQNLISWRYTRFLNELEPSEALVFVRALIELLESDTSSPAKVQRFNADVWSVLEAHDAATYAVSRSLPTLFLWLYDPADDIYVRTDLFDGLAKEIAGEKVFLNKRMDMNEYQRALVFAHEVRGALDEWGWRPRDMIDVQTFMWQAHTTMQEEEKRGASLPQVRELKGKYAGEHKTRNIQELVDLLEGDGLHFPGDLVANYILALQTKRFAILTGISGTGKTKLAIRVAEYYSAGGDSGPADSADRILVIAVRPDWTDPRGLLGYHNPISNQYLMTKFLALLLAARDEETAAQRDARPASPFFVILDEMNLARVEHYFSDFLSALESGRGLSLHDGARDLTSADDVQVPKSLAIPRNIFFTGTVNVDETTHMFSPKVLDRAFTLELNEVDLDGWALGETERPGASQSLHLPALYTHLRWHGQPGAEEWRRFGELLGGKLRETVTGLNAALGPTGYHFGYRVAGEIASFVLLAQRQGAASETALWAALDFAVLQKVLPKFNGTEQELELPLLIVAFAARYGRAPTETEVAGELRGALLAVDQNARLPRCSDKVDRMLARLQQRGFAAFIE